MRLLFTAGPRGPRNRWPQTHLPDNKQLQQSLRPFEPYKRDSREGWDTSRRTKGLFNTLSAPEGNRQSSPAPTAPDKSLGKVLPVPIRPLRPLFASLKAEKESVRQRVKSPRSSTGRARDTRDAKTSSKSRRCVSFGRCPPPPPNDKPTYFDFVDPRGISSNAFLQKPIPRGKNQSRSKNQRPLYLYIAVSIQEDDCVPLRRKALAWVDQEHLISRGQHKRGTSIEHALWCRERALLTIMSMLPRRTARKRLSATNCPRPTHATKNTEYQYDPPPLMPSYMIWFLEKHAEQKKERDSLCGIVRKSPSVSLCLV